ncbi:MAG: hypothetical protein ACRENH_16425 [Gemmatimonadaceae bacterium]
MHRARVRSLYDSEAVLRQAAGALRSLGWSDAPSRFAERPAGEAQETSARRELALARQASLMAALRRSREVLDTVARVLETREAAKNSAAR